MGEIVLSLKNISKYYPGVTALNNVSMDFFAGEVHALLGENGAGKSTLIKIIAGAIEPDNGEIIIGSNSYSKLDPHKAKDNGVEVIYQEFNLVDSLSAAENICLGERFGTLVDYSAMEKKANDILEKFGINIDPKALIRELPSSQQQIVEIGKAVSRSPKILIMDEPSAPLSVSEVEKLFEIIRQFKESGVSIIYISHRLDEIFEIADRVSIMRDGHYIKTLDISKTNRKELVSLMVGRELKESYPARPENKGKVALELRNASGKGAYNVSLTVHEGEILGMAGLVGAGRTELARIIYGAEKLTRGQILVDGREVAIKSPTDAIKYGIGLIPEDRKQQGCFLDMSIEWNISIANIKELLINYMVSRKRIRKQAEDYKRLLDIKTPFLEQEVKNLSGGNQQKVVLAKTLATNSKIIIFDEPTRGIDVGAKQEIYKLMCDLASQGKAIIMITSDMEELLGMSDRIVVIAEGEISGTLEREAFAQSRVLELASGIQ